MYSRLCIVENQIIINNLNNDDNDNILCKFDICIISMISLSQTTLKHGIIMVTLNPCLIISFGTVDDKEPNDILYH